MFGEAKSGERVNRGYYKEGYALTLLSLNPTLLPKKKGTMDGDKGRLFETNR